MWTAIPWLALVLAAIPPLAPDQRAQLGTATDGRPSVDEAALYPLLTNAGQWPDAEETGARVPDYKALDESPSEARGELFLIEGTLVKWNREEHWFSRPGPWDGRMQRWIIRVEPKRDRYVLVYLVDPGHDPDKLRFGSRVRMAGRFYKTWFDQDAGEKARTYLLFVGRDARIIYPPRGSDSLMFAAPFLAVAILVGAGWIAYRIIRPGRRLGIFGGGAVPIEGPEAYTDAREEDEPDDDQEEAPPPLPKDPVEAMKELDRRKQAGAGDQGEG